MYSKVKKSFFFFPTKNDRNLEAEVKCNCGGFVVVDVSYIYRMGCAILSDCYFTLKHI